MNDFLADLFSQLEEEDPTFASDNIDTPPPPEPPFSSEQEMPDDNNGIWSLKARNATSLDLSEKGTATLGVEGWVETERVSSEAEGITVLPNGVLVSNETELVTAVEPMDFAVVIRNPENSTIGLMQIDGRLIEHEDGAPNEEFLENIETIVSKMNDLPAGESGTQAVVCGPSTFPQEIFHEFAEKHPGPTLEETGMEVIDEFRQKSDRLSTILSDKFGNDNVTTIMSGEFQQVYVTPKGKVEVECFRSETSDDYDTHIIAPENLEPLISSSDDPEPFTKLNANNMQALVIITEMKPAEGQKPLSWLVSPTGEPLGKKDNPYSLRFEIDDSSTVNPEITLHLESGQDVLGSATGVIDGRTLRITNLPRPDQIVAPQQDVDVSLTLVKQLWAVSTYTHCDETTIAASPPDEQPGGLHRLVRKITGKPWPKTSQEVNDRAAEGSGFQPGNDGFWHLPNRKKL